MIQLSSRPGLTLLEILIVIALMAIMATIAGVSPVRHDDSADVVTEMERAVSLAQSAAVRTGRPVSVRVMVNGDSAAVLALPDGSVIADRVVPVARLTGRVRSHE